MPDTLPSASNLTRPQLLLALLIVAMTLSLGLAEKYATLAAVDTGLLGLFVLISPAMNRVVRIFGLEARLEGTLQKAEVTLNELRQLAVAVSSPAVAFLTPISITERHTIRYRVEAAHRIHDMLQGLEIEEPDLADLFQEFKSRILWRIKAQAVQCLLDHRGQNSGLADHEQRKEVISSSIDDIASFAERTGGADSPGFHEWLEDARVFEASLVLRRPELMNVT